MVDTNMLDKFTENRESPACHISTQQTQQIQILQAKKPNVNAPNPVTLQ